MKDNFQIELDNILQELAGKGQVPVLTLHSCCGPCSSYVLEYLKEHFDITVFYYNPNIYPQEEYEHRLREQERLIGLLNDAHSGMRAEPGPGLEAMPGPAAAKEPARRIKLAHIPYNHSEFTEYVKGLEGEPEGGARCSLCFRLRLEKTREYAESIGADYFATTLTVSPHKNALVINSIGKDLGSGKVLWLPSDFKKKEGYKKSIELSKRYELYRQDYCGCEYALRDMERKNNEL